MIVSKVLTLSDEEVAKLVEAGKVLKAIASLNEKGVTPIVVEKDYADFMVKSGMEDAKKAGLVVSGTVAVIGGSDTYDYHNTSEFNSYKTIGGICIV